MVAGERGGFLALPVEEMRAHLHCQVREFHWTHEDNGPQFTSQRFEQFIRALGVWSLGWAVWGYMTLLEPKGCGHQVGQ